MSKKNKVIILLLLLFISSSCTIKLHEKDLTRPIKYRYNYSDYILRKDVSIQVEDTVVLNGWYFNNPENKKTLIHFYGMGHTLYYNIHFYYWLSEYYKINVLCFDYREYGKSSGKASARMMQSDALKIYDYAVDTLKMNPSELYIYGMSIGTVPALHICLNRQVKGLILEGAPSSAQDYINAYFKRAVPWYMKPFIGLSIDTSITNQSQPIDLIKNYNQPLLLIVSKNDVETPLMFSQKLYNAAASKYKSLCILPEGRHDYTNLSTPPAVDSILSFFNLKD